jgi:signal transduction histidine kinase
MGKTAAAIAHELRNALNGLGMCVDLVLADAAPQPGSGSMRVRAQIHQEIARLRDVTESLLTFSRTPRLELVPADLNALVGRALDVLGEQITDAGVTVETALAGEGAPLVTVCDANKLQGVLINLIKNAVESMATRPLDLAGDGAPAPARERRVVIATTLETAEGAPGRLVVAVSDTGPGLPAVGEGRERLFEPFFTTKVTGTGLGLATARRIVEAHGGTLAAEDAPGGGARFVARLDHHPPAPADSPSSDQVRPLAAS